MNAEDLFVPDRPLALSEAEALARDVFGFDGRAERLWGERDQNFRLTAPSGDRALFKVSHPAEDPVVTNLQAAILTHLERCDPGLPVARIRPALSGELEPVWRAPGEPDRLMRLTSYLPGEPEGNEPLAPAALSALGAAAARLDLALADLSHPGETQDLLWDLQTAPRLRRFADANEDAGQRALALEGLDLFEREVLPALPRLRRQLIHNDLNAGNVLFQGDRVSGIVDFGDAVAGPLVQELAVCAAYHVRKEGDPLAAVGHILVGYEALAPLQPTERALLPAYIAGRLAMGLILGAWRARQRETDMTDVAAGLASSAQRLSRLLAALPADLP